jgi:hypothetical protein
LKKNYVKNFQIKIIQKIPHKSQHPTTTRRTNMATTVNRHRRHTRQFQLYKKQTATTALFKSRLYRWVFFANKIINKINLKYFLNCNSILIKKFKLHRTTSTSGQLLAGSMQMQFIVTRATRTIFTHTRRLFINTAQISVSTQDGQNVPLADKAPPYITGGDSRTDERLLVVTLADV